MWISQVELEAIKSYGQHTKIELRQGVNAICGQNGAGKSTILEAIGYALFGNSAYKQEQFINEKAKKGEIVIALVDSRDDRLYQVVRPIKGGIPYVYDPETDPKARRKLAEGSDGVQRWLCECMGVESAANLEALFENAIGVPQGLLAVPFLQTATNRKKVFDPLLGVEDYKKVWDNMLAVVNHVKELQANNREAKARYEGQLVDLPTHRSQLQELENIILAKETEQTQVTQKLIDLDQDLVALQKLQGSITDLANRYQTLIEQIKGLKKQLGEAETALAEAVQAGQLLEQREAGYQAYEEAQREQPQLEKKRQNRDKIQERLVKIEGKLALIQQTIEGLAQQLETAKTAEIQLIELAPLVEQQDKLERDRQQTEKMVAALKTAEERVTEEVKRLTDFNRQLVEIETQLTRRQLLTQEIEALQRQRGEQSKELVKLEESFKALGSQMADTRQSLKQARERKAEYQGIQVRIAEEEKVQIRRRDDLAKMQAELIQRSNLETELGTLEETRQKYKNELLSLAGQVGDQETAEQRIQATLNEWKLQAQALKHHQDNLSAAEKRLTEAEKRLSEIQKGFEQRLELSAQFEALETQQVEVRGQRDAIRSEMDRNNTQLETIIQAMSSLTVDQDSPCPVCKKPLSSHEIASLRAHYQTEQLTLEMALVKAQTKLKQSETTLKTLADQGKKVEAKRDKLPTQPQLETQQELVTTCRQEVVALEQQVSTLVIAPAQLNHYQQTLEQTQIELARLRSEQINLKKADAADEERQNQIQAEIRNLPRPADIDRVQAEINQAEGVLTHWREQANSLADAPQTVIHLEDNEKELEVQRIGLQEQQEQLNETRTKLETEVQRLQAEMNDLSSPIRVEELRVAIETQEKVLAEWRAKVTALSQSPAQLQTIESALQSLADPRSRQQVARTEANKRSTLESNLDQKHKEVETQKQTKAGIKAELDVFADLDAAIQRVQEILAINKEAHQTYLEQRKIAATLPERQSRLNDIQGEIDTAEKEMAKVQQEHDQATAGYSEDYHQARQKERDDTSRREAELITELKSHHARQQELQKAIFNLEKIEAEWEASKLETEHLDRLNEVIAFIRRTIRDAGPEVTKRLVKAISLNADQIFGDIMNDHQLELVWDENYAITVKKDGYERDFQQLSGGEAMAAALAVRLALLQRMSGVKVAFFDEPTANLDTERRANLAEQIARIKGFSQLVVISHDDTFEQDTHHVIHIGKDEQGYSRVMV
jgi:DNA repair exonuclease SbcCD ATPase subunit